MRSKKKVQVRARKVKSSGVWIAPDLERKIKGEGGRRGLSEPPYSYYLYLADLALRSSEPTSQVSPGSPTRTASSNMESDSIQLEKLPSAVPAKPPKLMAPKPPKTPLKPKPAKRVPTEPLRRPAPQKLRLPKPPKRGR